MSSEAIFPFPSWRLLLAPIHPLKTYSMGCHSYAVASAKNSIRRPLGHKPFEMPQPWYLALKSSCDATTRGSFESDCASARRTPSAWRIYVRSLHPAQPVSVPLVRKHSDRGSSIPD